MTTRDSSAIHRAQLADMPLATIVAWLRERGYWVERVRSELPTRVTDCGGVRRVYDRLPPGYPPRAEDDAPLPFEDGR